MSTGPDQRRRRSGRPLWLVEGLDIVEERRGPLLGAVSIVVVVPLLLTIFAPSIVPPTPLVGIAVAIAALLLGLAAALAVDTTDLIVRGPRHVGAAGGELVSVLPRRANPGAARDLAASVLDAREPGTQLLLGIAGAGREAAETAAWTDALGLALVRSGVSVLRIDLASGRTDRPGLAEVVQSQHRLTDVVEIEPGRRLARLGAGADPIRALRSLPSLPGRLPPDLDVLLVSLPSATNREVVNATRALDHVLVMAHRDLTSRVQLIAALDALDATGATAQVVLVDDRTVRRMGAGPSVTIAGDGVAGDGGAGAAASVDGAPHEGGADAAAVGEPEGASRDPGAVGEPPHVSGITGVGGGAVVAAQLGGQLAGRADAPGPEDTDTAGAGSREDAGAPGQVQPPAQLPSDLVADEHSDTGEIAPVGRSPQRPDVPADQPARSPQRPDVPADQPGEARPDRAGGARPDRAGGAPRDAASGGTPPGVAGVAPIGVPGGVVPGGARPGLRGPAGRDRDEPAERAAREQAAREQAAREQAERERTAEEQAARERAARLQAERVRAEREERERAEREQAEREAHERAQREEAARVEAERLRAAREEQERLEQAERQRVAEEQAARARAAREQAAREQAAREQAEREQAAREQAERERAARVQAERARAAEEQAARARAAREQVEREQAAREQAEREQAEREQAEREAAEGDQAASQPRDVDVLLGAAEAAALWAAASRDDDADPPAFDATTVDDRRATDPAPSSAPPEGAELDTAAPERQQDTSTSPAAPAAPAASAAPAEYVPLPPVWPPAVTVPSSPETTAAPAPAAGAPSGSDAGAEPHGEAARVPGEEDSTDELRPVRRPEPIRSAEAEQEDLLHTTAKLAVLMDDLDIRIDDDGPSDR